MDGFRFVTPVEVRFVDIDGMGHVNNAVFATFFELGRTRYFQRVLGAKGLADIDFILARQEIDFLAPILLSDEVRVGLRVSSIGRTSFEYEYELERNGQPAARGKSVQVFFDYARSAKKPVPSRFREIVETFEGRVFPSL